MKNFKDSYCHYVQDNELHKAYHDTEYGFPTKDDNELFKRLMLEVNQAGLSWTTILKKRETFTAAYDNFDVNIVANYTQKDRERLLSDPGIIRNKLKVNAAIFNANAIQQLQKEYGSFQKWLEQNAPKPMADWVKLFKKTFKFTGGEITQEFLMATGFVKGAHHPECPIYKVVLEQKPYWLHCETHKWGISTTTGVFQHQ